MLLSWWCWQMQLHLTMIRALQLSEVTKSSKSWKSKCSQIQVQLKMQVFTGIVMSCLDTLTSTMVGIQLLIDLKLRYLEDNLIQSQLLNLKGEWNLCPLLLLYPAVIKPDHYIGPSWAFFFKDWWLGFQSSLICVYQPEDKKSKYCFCC